VGNDPRATFNLLLGLLDQKIPHRIRPEELGLEDMASAAELSAFLDRAWRNVFSSYRRRGVYWKRKFFGLLLATGWYSVFASISIDGSRCIAEILHPFTVFPNWDDDLVECARVFPLSEFAAKRMIARNEWKVQFPPKGKTTCYDYWLLEDGKVYNGIWIANSEVKTMTHEPRFNRIPIFVGAVGGLPDEGEMAPDGDPDRWKGEMGQSAIVTNENIYKYWNKWWTFSMQLLRDTAQARTVEKTRSATKIVTPETWNKRGAHYKLAPEESIDFIAPPSIPVELRSTQLDMEAMMQRGGPSWAMFGNIQQQMTQYVMSQVSASTNMIAKPYHQGGIDCFSDIDNFWMGLIKQNKYRPYGIGLPEGLPSKAEVTADYEIKIPGDLVQRATTARMLDPDFRISYGRVMEELFPEVKNPMEEQAKVRAEIAEMHPARAQIALIESFRKEAELLRNAGDMDGAELYDKAADLVESSMGLGEEERPPVAPGAKVPGVRPEVVPPPSPTPPATV